MFLSKFICSLLQKGREGELGNAKDIASILLESGMQKLHLARIKFNSMAGDHEHWLECNRFCLLLDECLLSGLQQYVDELLRRGLGIVKAAPKNDGSSVLTSHWSTVQHRSTLAEDMLSSICEDFEKNKMPPSEPARDFVIAVLKKFVLTNLPKCPRPSQGHAHQPRGCGKCKHCEELDRFLVSRTEREREFLKGPKISAHMQSYLPQGIFQCTTRDVTQGKKTEYLLRLVKLGREYEVAMDAYKRELSHVLPKVRHFRTEYMKQLLGADAYGELVMLEHLPHSGDLELKREAKRKARPQAGMKRRAEEDTEPSAAKRWGPGRRLGGGI
jgi:hypothetical protein